MLFQNPYKLIQSSDPGKRLKAVNKLARKRDAEALAQLEKALEDVSPDVRTMAAVRLVNIKKEWAHSDLVKAQVPGIANLLKDGGFITRSYAADALGEIGTPEAVDALIARLDHGSVTDKVDVIKALGKTGSGKAVDPLVTLLKSKEFQLPETAAEALGEVGDKKAVDPLLEALKNGISRAAVALGKIGDTRAVEPLISALKPEKDKFKDVELITSKLAPGIMGPDDLYTRVYSAAGLGIMGDPRAVEPLMETLSKANKFVRRASAYALGLLKDPRSVDILISALKDEDPIVSRAAAGALWQIGSPAVDSLIRALEEKNTSVKFSSIIALGLIRDQRAMPALEKLLDHTQKEIEKKTLDSEELSKMKNLITESLELIKGEKSISQLMESPDDKELLERVLHVD